MTSISTITVAGVFRSMGGGTFGGAVVIAAGGFVMNPEMVHSFAAGTAGSADLVAARIVAVAVPGTGLPGEQVVGMPLRRSITGPLGEAEDLGRRLARTLVADGAPALADLSATHPTTASEHAQ